MECQKPLSGWQLRKRDEEALPSLRNSWQPLLESTSASLVIIYALTQIWRQRDQLLIVNICVERRIYHVIIVFSYSNQNTEHLW